MDTSELHLNLRPGVTFIRDEQGVGLRHGQTARYADDSIQRTILDLLSRGKFSPDELIGAICSAQSSRDKSNEASLTLARFILEFGDYLEVQS